MSAPYPLEGITVLDFGQIYNGPYAAFMLAMAGARVIKIEPPQGEPLRRRTAADGGSVPLAMLNANKEGVTLNLKHERGRELLHKMVMRADVLLENFAPTVMDRLGVGADVLMAQNPRLIYASRKTGLLVTEENLDKLPKGALEEWNAALDEYDERMKGEPS